MIYVYCAILIVIYVALYFVFGNLFRKLFIKENLSLALQILLGYFVYHFCFYLLCLPLKLSGQSLTLLTILWGIVLLLVVAAFLRSHVKRDPKEPEYEKSGLSVKLRLLVGAFIFLLITLMNVNMQTGALWDQSHYVGEVSTSVYTDSLKGYDMYTGKRTKQIDEEYMLEITESHSAVMCKLFHMHPSVEVRTVRATVNILIFYLLVLQLGMLLFKEEEKRLLFFFFFVALDLFSYNLHTRAQILIYRAFEGKAVLANLILFMILYLYLVIFKEPEKKQGWIMLFMVIAASFGLNMTSILLVPALFAALMIPLLIAKKDLRGMLLKRSLLCLLPWVPETLFYLWMH